MRMIEASRPLIGWVRNLNRPWRTFLVRHSGAEQYAHLGLVPRSLPNEHAGSTRRHRAPLFANIVAGNVIWSRQWLGETAITIA
jgi:hypothetical protein